MDRHRHAFKCLCTQLCLEMFELGKDMPQTHTHTHMLRNAHTQEPSETHTRTNTFRNTLTQRTLPRAHARALSLSPTIYHSIIPLPRSSRFLLFFLFANSTQKKPCIHIHAYVKEPFVHIHANSREPCIHINANVK